jgi:hypothetical protein
MLFSSRNYAIGMAHYQIAGGLKSLLLLLGGYLLVAAAIIGMMLYNADPADLPRMLLVLATLFLAMEGFGLVVMGAVRVAACIRMDFTSNMIESHRQMPISAARAMLGYYFGATVHIVAICALHVIVLAILESFAGVGFQTFVTAQLVLAAFALFAWTTAAMGSLMYRQAMPIIVLVCVFGSCSSMFLRGWGLLPGVSLLAAPFLGETIFTLAGGRISMHAAYPVALTSQMAFSTLFFIGACRRYRGSYLTTFNVPMGVALVGVWGGLSAIAIQLWPSLLGTFARDFVQPAVDTQIVAALGVAAVLMIVPTFALAAWESRHPVTLPRRILALAGIVLAGSVVMTTMGFNFHHWAITLLVLMAHALTVYGGLRFCARMAPLAMAVFMIALEFCIWVLPVLVEVVRWYFLPENRLTLVVHDFSLISTFSPLGVLLVAWGDDPNGPFLWLGIVLQLGLAGLMLRLVAQQKKKAQMRPVTV